MKRVIIASVMVCVILITAITSNIIINNSLNNLLSEIKEITANAETISDYELEIKCKSLISKWVDILKYLQFFESHDKYEAINSYFSLLRHKFNCGYKNEIFSDIVELENIVSNYTESRKISFRNVL